MLLHDRKPSVRSASRDSVRDFLENFSPQTKSFGVANPIEFVDQLAEKWDAFPDKPSVARSGAATGPISANTNKREEGIFIREWNRVLDRLRDMDRPSAALRDDPLRAKEFSFKPASLKVLLAMREDYLADIDRIRSHFRALGQNRLRLLPMGERQARQVIALGARLLAPGVDDRIRAPVGCGDRQTDRQADEA
jgi:hypothetical protein